MKRLLVLGYFALGFLARPLLAQSAQPESTDLALIQVPPLLGRWECTNEASPVRPVIDFRENGTFLTETPFGVFRGSWQWITKGVSVSHTLRGGRPFTILIRSYSQNQFQSSMQSTPNLIDTCKRVSTEVCVRGDCIEGPGSLYDMKTNLLASGTFVSGSLQGAVTTSQRFGTDLISIETTIVDGKAAGQSRITGTSETPYKHVVITGVIDSAGKISGSCRYEFIAKSEASRMVFEGICDQSFPTLGRYSVKDRAGVIHRITITDFSVKPWLAVLKRGDSSSEIKGAFFGLEFQSAPNEPTISCRVDGADFLIQCTP